MKRPQSILGMTTLAVVAIALLAGGQKSLGAGQDNKPGAPSAIKIDNFSFGPATLTIPVGTTVTWTNDDDVPHTVVSVDKLFKGPALDTDEKFSYTFTKPGTYEYFCSVHPKMTAKIVVQ